MPVALTTLFGSEIPEVAVWFLQGTLVTLGVFGLTLLILLVTHWGDKHATGKALCLSILLHVCFWLSWRSAVLMKVPSVRASTPEPPIKIQRFVLEGEERAAENQPGNTPVWEQLANPVQPELARLERSPHEFEPLAGPVREPEDPFEMPPPELPQLAARPDEPTAVPELREQADVGERTVASVPLKIDEPTAEARPDVQLPAVSRERQPITRSGPMEQADVQRAPLPGAAARLDPEPQPVPLTTSIDAPTGPVAAIPEGELDDVIQRRTSPAPVALPQDQQGTEARRPGEGSNRAAPSSRFTRQPSRTVQTDEDGSLERFRPQVTPTTPQAERNRLLAVRSGTRTDLPIEGPQANINPPNFDAVRTRETARLPATYRLRELAKRKDVALSHGGTDASERAVELSLQWLAAHQNPEGFWDADGFHQQCPAGDQCTGPGGLAKTDPQGNDRRGAGTGADSGVTGLAILAFLGAGYTQEEGRYADQVDRALRWLIRQQRDDGYLGAAATYYEANYCHAIAAYAMGEALAMQNDRTDDPQLRQAVARAVEYTLSIQSPDGGWRYRKGQQSDMSMFGWQLMALKSAENGGIEVPTLAKAQMIDFLKKRSLGTNGGLASYRADESVTPAMTAEALFSKQILGLKRSNPASVEAVIYLQQHLPRLSQRNDYYWYYGTLAMFQYGGQPWDEWNAALRDTLISTQRTTGHAAGSWDPNGPWGGIGGRIYSTALCTLCLEVYYRFLPLYQVNEEEAGP